MTERKHNSAATVLTELLLGCYGSELIQIKAIPSAGNSLGRYITDVSIYKSGATEVFAKISIYETSKQNFIKIVSYFSDEVLDDLFTILNEEPYFGKWQPPIPKKDSVEGMYKEGQKKYSTTISGADRGTIRLTAYNLNKFIKQVISKTLMATITKENPEFVVSMIEQKPETEIEILEEVLY